MSRYIDADKIIYSWQIDPDGQEHDGVTLQSIINKMPSIDAVQVVRCKDCLFNDGEGPNEDDKYWCALHQSFMQYCSDAERKEA